MFLQVRLSYFLRNSDQVTNFYYTLYLVGEDDFFFYIRERLDVYFLCLIKTNRLYLFLFADVAYSV